MRDQKYINFYETHLSTAENRKRPLRYKREGENMNIKYYNK